MQLKDIKAVRSFINGLDDDLLVKFLQGMCEEAVAGAIEATKEKAAKVCEAQITGHQFLATHGHWDHMDQACVNCAAVIRSMK